ncbi:hypothetical protein VTJ83DRAFT_2169 [Remersonia thermophila]|uniref:Uncharacterized protein n=1 Tax=Remersonia thermophila TaxID=72144 RepID=A0ABR4DIL4_9PEZI
MSAESQPITPARFAAALKDLTLSSLYLKLLELRNSIAHLDYSNEQLRPYAEGTAVALGSAATAASSSSSSSAAASAAAATSQPLPEGHQGPQPPPPAPPPVVAEPDQDCIDAIKENEEVIERMQERIRLLRAEVESRGIGWEDFQGQGVKDEEEEGAAGAAGSQTSDDGQNEEGGRETVRNGAVNGLVNGDGGTAAGEGHANGGGQGEGRHAAWSDGTFQTGVIRQGELHMDAAAGSRQGQARQGGSLSDEELRRRVEEQMRSLGVGEGDENDNEEEGGLYL